MTIAFVGDIHGDLHRLTSLLGKIPDDMDRIVFLGDYVNRGPRSAAVVEYLIKLSNREPDPGKYTFLEGHWQVPEFRSGRS